jgi:hypothetical protein
VLAADICHSQSGLLLFDHPDDLRLSETALADASAPSGLGRLYIRLRELPGGRSQLIDVGRGTLEGAQA